MLRRALPPSRAKAIKRILMARRTRAVGPDIRTVQKVVMRDGWRCVVCGDPVRGQRGLDWSIHHRRGRDGKPDTHQPQNLITVCGGDNHTGCHGRIHQRRSESQPNGWWLSRVAGEDPLRLPLLIFADHWVYLTADYGFSDTPPPQETS